MWQSKNFNVTIWWCLEKWVALVNLSLRWWIWNFTLNYLHVLAIRKNENFVFETTFSLLRATELSQSPRKLLSEQRKNLPMSRPAHARHHCAMLILLFFWCLLTHFKNIFISPVWEVNNCIAWIKGMVGNCNKFKILINLLWKKDVEKLAHPCAFKAEKPTSLCVCVCVCVCLCVRKYIPHSYCFDLTSWY